MNSTLNTTYLLDLPIDTLLFGDLDNLHLFSDLWKKLTTALYTNDIRAVSALIEAHPHLAQEKGLFGGTALMQSCSLETLQILIPHSDTKAQDESGENALMCFIARTASQQCAEAIIPFSDIDAVNQYGKTALILASEYNRIDIVKLLAPYANHELRSSDKFNMGYSALDSAALAAYPDIILELLPYKPKGRTAEGLDPLMIVSKFKIRDEQNRIVCADILMKEYSPLNVDHRGWNALMYAAYNKMWDLCSFLVPFSDLNQKTQDGKTILSFVELDNPLLCIIAKQERDNLLKSIPDNSNHLTLRI